MKRQLRLQHVFPSSSDVIVYILLQALSLCATFAE